MPAKASIICLSTFLLVTTGCDLFGPEPRLSHAVALAGIGPADGPTTVILLADDPIDCADPSLPHVQIVIWESVSGLAGRTWDITSDTGPGAWYVTWRGIRQSATSGRVSITSVDSTNKIDGTVELQFPARTVATQFSAPWVGSQC